MITLSIQKLDIKYFMSKLFKGDIFDNFEVRGIKIKTITTIELNGILNNLYFDEDTENVFCTWGQIKVLVISLIKGNRPPTSIKIVFSLNTKNTIFDQKNLKSLYLNIDFENDFIICTTATSQIVFDFDKKESILWDEYIIDFFKQNQIPYI